MVERRILDPLVAGSSPVMTSKILLFMKETILEIRKACPRCSYGMGLFMNWGKHGFIHLDIMATKEAGAMYTCGAADLIKPYIVKYADNGKPEFTAEFNEAYDSISENYSDMTKADFSTEAWGAALINYFRWDYEVEYDESKLEGLTLDKFQPMYDDGLTILEALNKYFLN